MPEGPMSIHGYMYVWNQLMVVQADYLAYRCPAAVVDFYVERRVGRQFITVLLPPRLCKPSV
jgi:hypothetical protein